MSIIIKDKKTQFEVTFKYDTAIYHAMRELDGAYWVAGKRMWIVPRKNKENLLRLQARFNKEQYDSSQVLPTQGELVDFSGFVVDKSMPALTINIPLKLKLRDYQEGGVAYAMEKKSCLMGDQQGLGKTIVAIAATVAENAFPALVICKSALMTNWEREIKAWSYQRPLRLGDSVKRAWPDLFRTGFAQFGIVSFDSLKKYFVEGFEDLPPGEPLMVKNILLRPECSMFKTIIVDESHLIKDPGTMRTKLTTRMCLRREHVYLLSGTPILNNPEEIYPQLVALGKHYHFGKMAEFKKLFGKNSKRLKEALPYLNYLLHKNCYFRRLKSEVAKDIPPKTRQIILCDIDNRAEYDQAENHFEKFLKERLNMTGGQIDKTLRAEALVQISYLKGLSAKGKLQHIYDWMETQENEGEKAVIFAFHKEIQQAIYSWKKEGTVRLCSSAPPDVLQKRKDAFQEREDTIRCVCSLMADAEGHTLTAASNLAMYELPWHFGKAEQCEDRIHRIGTIYPVTISYFLGERTIDRKIYDIIMAKKDMHDLLTGTEEEAQSEVVDKLINLFNQK